MGKKLVLPVISFINQKYTSIQGCFFFRISKWNFLDIVVFLLKDNTDTKCYSIEDVTTEDNGNTNTMNIEAVSTIFENSSIHNLHQQPIYG
ncbi:unnamed protein product [Adineta ricciae]|uniref:Uncharacterized protein n=1 Tax=Adineta ricciae TaxID=249248 RepID=A0A813NIN8_ADIRI|nr:unnamed protein product [Adineta ricciae]